MAFLCFPLMVGRMRITIFHFLLSCTLVFSLLWGYLIVTVISRCNLQKSQFVKFNQIVCFFHFFYLYFIFLCFSAFKEEEVKYKMVPEERQVNALDFF